MSGTVSARHGNRAEVGDFVFEPCSALYPARSFPLSPILFQSFPSRPLADTFSSGLLESRLESSAERLVMPLARPGEMGVAGCTEEEVMDPRYW